MFDLSACKGPETMTSMVVATAEYSSVEMRSMDFISGLPKARRDFNVIWAIEDKLTIAAHSIPGKPLIEWTMGLVA